MDIIDISLFLPYSLFSAISACLWYRWTIQTIYARYARPENDGTENARSVNATELIS